ncbi:hypothetical protein ACH4E7_17015 [Kitasatospora sp. NPDC018058]|uniref:hypothetical protein n=1 Tax=Kitasatospora sp. NPDC018058 TaxID=3364025 RepID=UPI0037C05FAD
MPASARWLAGVAVAVFVPPLVLIGSVFGIGWPYVHHLVGLVSAAACAVPVAVPACSRRRDHFRVACAAAGFTVAAVWVPLTVLAFFAVLVFGGWAWFLTCLSVPVAAITALIAAFQRARGPECGRTAAVLGWSAAAASVAGWFLLVVQRG